MHSISKTSFAIVIVLLKYTEQKRIHFLADIGFQATDPYILWKLALCFLFFCGIDSNLQHIGFVNKRIYVTNVTERKKLVYKETREICVAQRRGSKQTKIDLLERTMC